MAMPLMRFLTACLLAAAPAAAAAQRPLAITNVQILDVAKGQVSGPRTVIVQGNLVVSVGLPRRTQVPAGASKLDGRGRFLMPGLWDMGSFVLDGTRGAPGAMELMIAHGVVGTRDLGTAVAPVQIKALLAEIESGRRAGPKLIWTTKALSRTLDAETSGAARNRLDLRSREEAEAAVDQAARAGAHYIRTVQNFPEQWLPAVVARARRHGLAVTGAVVSSWAGAANDGLAGFDHFVDLYRSTARKPERDQFLRLYRDSAFRRATAKDRNGMYAFFAPLRGLRDHAYYRSTLAAVARAGTPVITNMATTNWAQQMHAERIEARRRFARPEGTPPPPPPSTIDGKSRDGQWSDIRDMRNAGIPLMAGTIAEGSPRLLPGATLLDELELLVRAGLTPREALASATVVPAAQIARLFPRVAAAGAVAPGQPADLLLLDGNPLADIGNIRRIHGVVANGRWYGPAERQTLLDQAARLAAQAP
jgi:hypothetical protein